MTVEAYLRARVPGYPFERTTLEDAALSPILAKPKAFRAIGLADVIEDNADDEEFLVSLKYATSTLYYSVAGVFSGGSRSEQMGNIRTSLSGFIITQADREYYRNMADTLRDDLGSNIEKNVTEDSGAFDATYMRRAKL